MSTSPAAARFPELPPERRERWLRFPRLPGLDRPLLPAHLGLVLEEVRLDYARMRLPYRPELDQPLGVVHGGAIAALIDTVVVPAIGSAYAGPAGLLTLDMQIQYVGALREEDAIAEGWVEKRGRSICFCRAEVRAASGDLVALGMLTYKVRPPTDGA
ncbi:MAG: PaaI family thioesterase [Myxococcota bacterium]